MLVLGKLKFHFAFSENLQWGFELVTVTGFVSRKSVWAAESGFDFSTLVSLGSESTGKHFIKC